MSTCTGKCNQGRACTCADTCSQIDSGRCDRLYFAPGVVEHHKRPASAAVRFTRWSLMALGEALMWGVLTGAVIGLVMALITVAMGG